MRTFALESSQVPAESPVNLAAPQLADHQASRLAQAVWAEIDITRRILIVRRFRHLLAEKAEQLAALAAGQPRRAVGEVLAAEILPLAEACRFLEREAARLLRLQQWNWRGRAAWLHGCNAEVKPEPLGLILIIAPSNYPLLLPGVQVLQALVAGNAVLLKPGLGGLAVAQELARLWQAAGLPGDLLRVLDESVTAAQAALTAGVDKVIFTGSAGVGREILAQLAPRLIPAVMELSGSDAVLVRADADLDLAAQALVFGLRLNSGRTCIAPRRVFVARAVATEFEGRLAAQLAQCEALEFGAAQEKRCAPLIAEALADGAHLLCGEISPDQRLRGPVVVAGAKPDCALLSSDLFGPVLGVVTVADDEEALRLANASTYGLGAVIFSTDLVAARRLADRLQVGSVVLNDLIAPTADARLPFGGRKASGFGLTRGPEGLLEMTTTKVVIRRAGAFRPHYRASQASDAAMFANYLCAAHGRGLRQRCAALLRLARALFLRAKAPKQIR